ncbi:MAG TPA: RNA-directed DNA polymerase [Bacilli bacterium]|nr:RNA-directed DNA polymerase [Bacilli bacterium]
MSLEEIFTFENIYAAHKWCRKSKQHKGEVVRFEIDLSKNITELIKELTSRKYKLGKYRKFKLFEPKERLIEALSYKDRVVLMCFVTNVLKPIISKHVIYDNAACQKNKGTDFGLNRLTKFLKREFINEHGNDFYYLKCDIHKYFPSINHEVLLNKLKRIGLTDDELYMARLFMTNYETSVGIPLGNLSSQWYALIYLDDLDRFIKEKLQIKGYIRYMDDFILIHKDKNYLRYCLKEIDSFCKERLKVELNAKTQIGKVKNGIDFLGFRLILTETGKVIKKLRGSSKRRIKRHLRNLKKLEDKGIVDREYVNIRKNYFYSRIDNSDESRTFLNKAKPEY